MFDEALIAAARVSKSWPFQEAMKLVKRYPDGKPGGAPVLFETGYGPSGLPHIGTFQEVLRTTLVRRAYEIVSGGAPTRLVAFSDDMDGLRKVPDNVPNKALMEANLGKPLSRIPDPFAAGFESFAHHNNAMLRDFLDRFGFDYEFVAASERYNSGAFDDALRLVLERYQAIMDIMLPTLRAERQATYSPVLPISEKSGAVLQVPVEVVDAANGIVRFEDEGDTVEQARIVELCRRRNIFCQGRGSAANSAASTSPEARIMSLPHSGPEGDTSRSSRRFGSSPVASSSAVTCRSIWWRTTPWASITKVAGMPNPGYRSRSLPVESIPIR